MIAKSNFLTPELKVFTGKETLHMTIIIACKYRPLSITATKGRKSEMREVMSGRSELRLDFKAKGFSQH